VNHRVGNGGQGRNRTIDTRIFSTTESLVRRRKAEERDRGLDGPTEPNRSTEPMPNTGAHRPSGPGGGSRRVNGLLPSRPSGDQTWPRDAVSPRGALAGRSPAPPLTRTFPGWPGISRCTSGSHCCISGSRQDGRLTPPRSRDRGRSPTVLEAAPRADAGPRVPRPSS